MLVLLREGFSVLPTIFLIILEIMESDNKIEKKFNSLLYKKRLYFKLMLDRISKVREKNVKKNLCKK